MNINEKISSVLGYVRDSVNPYTRLVHSAMNTDKRSVPFYQMEEVREASFQSDHACEMIVKALAPSLDESSSIVLSKALSIFRVLFIEGANGIRIRMARLRGSLSRIANLQDVGRGTLEASNRDLARAFLEAMDGNSDALASFPTVQMSGAREEEYTSPQSYKSEFQTMHEKERRMYRRQCEEEKRQSAVIVRGRIYGTFDGSLSPEKLAEQVVASPKKRFAQTELDSFVSAAIATERVTEVCAALDQHLQGARQTLQNRYKVLLVVEALVSSGVKEAQDYYRENNVGICRHLTMNSVENPVKAEAAQSTARRITQALQAPLLSSAPAPTVPPRHVIAPQQPTVSQLDDLFSGVSVQKKPAATSSSHVPSLQDISADAVIEDIFGPAPRLQSAPLPPTATPTGNGTFTPKPSLPQLLDQNHKQVEKQQQEQSTLSFILQNFPPSGENFISAAQQLTPDFLGSFQGASTAAGELASQANSFGTSSEQRAGNGRSDADKLRLMQQIQAQIEMTRRMLEQQQSALLALQAEFQKN
ncbi:hypothetical protein TcYC6_0127590 [Trypanosoma cruzi]|nr:hypothetical protein TcYC6_0127590 [Trypanosoma cruzi]